MQIIVNGEQRDVDDGLSAAQLVEEMQITGKRIAMEVNLEIVPRSIYTEHIFKAGDKVEIVHAVGGG
jgi:sulfur carrier protein